MPDHPNEHPLEVHTASFTHILRALRAYLPVMTLALAVVAVGYAIVAAVIYTLAPSTRVTTVNFRLEFEGADRGQYPNGSRFAASEIISTPILLKTYNGNNLTRFLAYAEFAGSLFVLQSNPAAEALAREYQSRLSDARLSAIDRERIQRDYESRLASLAKDMYALQWVRNNRRDAIPETVIRKTLHDVLRNWADFVTKEQHVLEFRLAVLSPDVVASIGSSTNPIIDAIMLRDKALRMQQNIESILALPSADLVRTSEGLSLTDLAVRLDDVVRYRLDPMVNRSASSSIDDRAETIRFLETQLAHDQRRLDYQLQRTAAIQQTLAMYLNERRTTTSEATETERPAEGEVTPQLSESFLDRLIQITTAGADVEYRRGLAEQYRLESMKLAPAQLAVSYDKAILDFARTAGGAGGIDAAAAGQAIAAARKDIRDIAVEVHEIYKNVSSSLNPATHLMTVNAPLTQVERGVSLKKLALYGFLLLALALPVLVILSLIHNHLKDEEDEERLATSEATT